MGVANTTSSARAICPYYLRAEITEGGKSVVVCEGVSKNSETAIIFRSRAAILEWMNGRCETYEYASCPYARMVQAEIDRRQE